LRKRSTRKDLLIVAVKSTRRYQILIILDPYIQSGAPVFAGTRVPVQNLFDYLAEGDSLNAFSKQFPSVPREQAVADLEKARGELMADARASS
jgi:uncharacterized protein (DUF433 family)